MIKRILIFFGIIVFLGLLSVYYPKLTENFNIENYELEEVYVSRIVDGDTIDTSIGKIRLLGIDTPERGEEGYEEASEFLNEIENKNVSVLRDFDDIDKYFRKLRYVFYEDRLINVEILENGLGRAFMTEDLVYEDKFLRAEEFAKLQKIGLWEYEN